MLRIYLNDAVDREKLIETDKIVDGCLVNLVNPSEKETEGLATQLGIDLDDLRAPLDIEERSRFVEGDDYVLVIIDIPLLDQESATEKYITIPFGIIVAGEVVVTTCLFDTPLMDEFLQGRVRGFRTAKKTRFILQLLLNAATHYLQDLTRINARSEETEKSLHNSMRNKELIEMLSLQKSLVYFTTSLRSNHTVLDKLLRSKAIIQYPNDEELLEDVIEENKQAIEMTDIYSNILSSTMDAYASVIANNQSTVMKMLALITIILSIPTMIFSAYGMNLVSEGMPLTGSYWGFAIIIGIALVVSIITGVIFYIKKWF